MRPSRQIVRELLPLFALLLLPSAALAQTQLTFCGDVTAFDPPNRACAALPADDGSLTVDGRTFPLPCSAFLDGASTSALTALAAPGVRGEVCMTISFDVNGNVRSVYAVDPGPGSVTNSPGDPFLSSSEVNDQKAGSVLIYNLYSSNAASPEAENTRISITNARTDISAFVHLFFVDGMTCTPADVFICLTPNQTASFLASDIDPGVMGYVIAVAADPFTGCPVSHNYLIGSEYIKLASGHAASLGAEAIAARFARDWAQDCSTVDLGAGTARLDFDGFKYNRLPRVLAVDNIPSPADGNNTLLVVNRIGGDLAAGASSIGPIWGLLYDDAENAYSFTFNGGCQFKRPISSIRLLNGGLQNIIPSGRSGWMKLWATADVGLLGAVFNANTATGVVAGAFTGGRNLHKLSLAGPQAVTIPLFPTMC